MAPAVSEQDLEFTEVPCPSVQDKALAPLAEEAAQLLVARQETVTVFDATTGGLIQACFLARPGASKYATCAANTISTRRSVQLLGEPLVAQLTSTRPTDAASYKASKRTATLAVAREMRRAVGATWCIVESGACGPTFSFPGIDKGFTAICVSGPLERAVWVESGHADREANMWGFTKAAFDLLYSCLKDASDKSLPAILQAPKVFEFKSDHFRGVTIDIAADSRASVSEFSAQLKSCLAEWADEGKRGIWFKVPLNCARFVGPLTAERFKFHHAKEEYVMLTRWLEESPSKLPRYSFTQIGVGGAVVNSKNEVLMIQEKIQADANFQGLWKLPGGLADPGEDLATAGSREVLEETGVASEFEGVVSLRHGHGMRFGQGDIYCVVRLRALSEEIKLCPEEIAAARWMSLEEIEKLVPKEKKASMAGCVSPTTFKVIQEAVNGSLIQGTVMPSTAGKSVMVYTAKGLSKA
eukprot:TRINITY_DN88619_c0_g1_i1.p1 TRINITY_DN88619_c0_g1~~TRINITY_DN88619_c0_g1_i1.p1  ORF type:complete len:470 (-),score=86.31 TRINITY_DN88619_c0_g1_i1:38-1447(-)